MKIKIFIIMITITSLFLIFSNCTILSERWAIEWDNTASGTAGTLKIYNNTDETITTVKYYVGDNPPYDWSNQKMLTGYIIPNTSISYTIGTSSASSIILSAAGNNTVWIKVAADGYFQSQLFAQDGFLYESADQAWLATIHKEGRR